MWLIVILGLLAMAFVGYAAYTQFSNTDPGQPVFRRVWAAMGLAAMAIGALVMALFHVAPAP